MNRRPRETPEVAAAAARMIRAVAVRAETDVDALPLLTALGDQVEDQLRGTVHGARASGWSWADVSRVLGISRQAAHERFTRPSPRTTP